MTCGRPGLYGLRLHYSDGKLVSISGPEGLYTLQEPEPPKEEPEEAPAPPDFATAIWALVVAEIRASITEYFGDIEAVGYPDEREISSWELGDWIDEFAKKRGVK